MRGDRWMEAVLMIGHGSRDPEGNREVREFVDSLRPQLGVPIIETCFLELELPTMRQGLEACVAKGATRVIVIPLMLFSAGHAKIHIPDEIDEIRKLYPHIEFVYGRPIGIHDQVLDILLTRVEEQHVDISAVYDDLSLLVVGRGSSDPDANSDLFKMSRLLWERLKVKWVETAFIGVRDPLMEEGLERCIRLGARKVLVLPYFLFTGVLIKRMEDMLENFRKKHPECEFAMAEYFGFHPSLRRVIEDRIQEARDGVVKVNCDVCQYRLNIMKHTGHHHDHGHSHHHHHHDHHHHHHDDHHEVITK